MSNSSPHPIFGAGLRTRHYSHLLERPATRVEWFEAISENYMHTEGRPMQVLEAVRRDYPVALHGVSLSIASPDGVDRKYIERLRSLAERIQPFLVSDHLCFSRYRGHYLHDLLPFPCSREALDIVCRNVDAVQEVLGRRLALENASVYLAFPDAEMSEAEFLARVVERTGAGVLLDLNNLYVNQRNVGAVPAEYFERIPSRSVLQMHLAGYSDPGRFFFDTHSAPVYAPVWDLFTVAMQFYPMVPVCIEWDEAVPEFSVLEDELQKARRIRRQVLAEGREYIGFLQGSPSAPGIFPPPSDDVQLLRQGPSHAIRSLIDLQIPGPGHEDVDSPAPVLDGVQRAFHDLLLSGSTESFPFPVQPAGELEPLEALDVYVAGYLARREEAVLENHRGTAWLLGGPVFYEITHRYLRDVYSTEYDLNRYGRDFHLYLEEEAGEDPLLMLAVQMARLDRAFVEVFHRGDSPGVDRDRLASLNEGQDLLLRLSPSLEILSLEYRVYDLWKKRDAISPPGPPGMGDRNPMDFRGSEILALYRREGQVYVLRLHPWQKNLLEDIRGGHSLASAVDRLGESFDGSPSAVQNFFALLVREGMIADVQSL